MDLTGKQREQFKFVTSTPVTQFQPAPVKNQSSFLISKNRRTHYSQEEKIIKKVEFQKQVTQSLLQNLNIQYKTPQQPSLKQLKNRPLSICPPRKNNHS